MFNVQVPLYLGVCKVKKNSTKRDNRKWVGILGSREFCVCIILILKVVHYYGFCVLSMSVTLQAPKNVPLHLHTLLAICPTDGEDSQRPQDEAGDGKVSTGHYRGDSRTARRCQGRVSTRVRWLHREGQCRREQQVIDEYCR